MTIGVGQTILASDFNAIRTKIYNVLGPVSTGYGYTGASPSLPVATNDTIRAQDWLALYDELNRCIIHQTNNSIVLPTGTVLPAPGDIIYANFVTALDTYATQAETNKTVLAAGQTDTTSVNGSSSRVTSWGSNISHQVTYTWPDGNAARYFFNLGGKIQLSASTANGTGSGDDNTWISLISAANNVFDDSGKFYTVANYNSGINLTYVAAQSGAQLVRVTYSRPALNQVVVTVDLETSGTNINLDVTVTSTVYYSRGDLGGVGAQVPAAQVTLSLQTGGAVTPVVIPTKVLSIPTSISAYTFNAGATSSAQTITLSNLGNTALNISDITFTNNGNVTALPAYSWGASPVTSINSGSSKTFTLAYSGSTVGSYNNSFTVISDNDTGPVSKATAQTVNALPFDFTLNPVNVAYTTGSRNVINQFFGIVPYNGSFSSYSASLSGSTGYTLDTTDPAGPRVIFNPAILSNGVYSTTLSVTVNAITRTASISITLAAPVNQNIGTWLSAKAKNNAVIGMSYDYIGGDRYLTIGVGMNADGVGDLNNGGDAYVDVNNLGISADSKYDQGVALYESTVAGDYVSLLVNYGVWFRPASYTTTTLLGLEIERSYKINVTQAGTYNWEFSADDTGYFDIDGAICGDVREIGAPWRSVQTGSIYLSAGPHVLTLRAINYDGSGSVAIRIRNASTLAELWNTRMPVRTTSPYQYWGEVYRIPLTNGATTYYSKDYCVKDYSLAAGTSYGDRFGDAGYASARSMFTVQDDGLGNLTITINNFTVATQDAYLDDTMTNLSFAIYYYEALATIVRLNQLSGPVGDGSQTEQFLGFNANGTVRTSLVTYPGYGAGSGFTGGFGWNPFIGKMWTIVWDPDLGTWTYDYNYYNDDIWYRNSVLQ